MKTQPTAIVTEYSAHRRYASARRFFLCAFAAGLLVFFSAGCDKSSRNESYFPHEVGTEWVYRITIPGQPEPARFGFNRFSVGTKEIMYANSGRFYGAVQHPEKRVFELRLVIKSKAGEQGPLSYADGVEVEVLNDELQVFHQAKRLFWAIAPDGQVTQVTMIPRASGVPDDGMMRDGHNRRLVFFLDDRMSSFIGQPYNTLWELPQDKLSFMGVDGHYVRFKREVDPGHGEIGGFTEETWFEKGKGLARLEQKVDGKLTMLWELQHVRRPSSN